jgi:hypothetical protein
MWLAAAKQPENTLKIARGAMWLAAPKKPENVLKIACGGRAMEDGSLGERSELGRGREGGRRGQQRDDGKIFTIIL